MNLKLHPLIHAPQDPSVKRIQSIPNRKLRPITDYVNQIKSCSRQRIIYRHTIYKLFVCICTQRIKSTLQRKSRLRVGGKKNKKKKDRAGNLQRAQRPRDWRARIILSLAAPEIAGKTGSQTFISSCLIMRNKCVYITGAARARGNSKLPAEVTQAKSASSARGFR